MALASDGNDDPRARRGSLRCPRCLRPAPASRVTDGVVSCASCGALSCADLDGSLATSTSSSSVAIATASGPVGHHRFEGDGDGAGSPYRRTPGGPSTLRVSWRSGKHSWQRMAVVIGVAIVGGGLVAIGSPLMGLIWSAVVAMGGFRPSRAFVELRGSSGRMVRGGVRVEIVQGRRCCLTRAAIQTEDGLELEEYTLHVIEQDGANKSLVIDVDRERSLAVMRAVDAALILHESDR